MATLVKFRIEPETKDVVAIFPQLNHNKYTYGTMLKVCYSHIGQHGCCGADYYNLLKSAKIEEYADLKKELESIGYTNLKICK